MAIEMQPELAACERRLREIEWELAELRREQRLFRRIGYGENLKAMQIVTLQIERRQCLEILQPGRNSFELDPDSPLVRAQEIAKYVAGHAAVALGLMLLTARVLLSIDLRNRVPRRQQRPVGNASLLRRPVAATEVGSMALSAR